VIDADGYIRLTGRLKEQINRGGQKIAPREIDEVLLGHPRVKQAVAFAIPHAQLGEEVGAAVELTAGAGVDASVVDADGLDLSVLRDWAGARLATYKVPRIILRVDEIPKGPTGKVQRIGMAQRLGIAPMDDALRQAPFTPPRNSLEERIAAVWREMLGRNDIGVLDRFEAVGGDSLLAVGMLAAVGAAEGVDLPYLRFLTEGTIESLAKEIEAGKMQPASLLLPVQPRGNRPPQNQQHGVERQVHPGLTPDDRLKSAFRRGLALPGNFDASSAEADRTRTWDSVGHLQLVLALEDEFGIRLDPTDVIELKSYLDAKAILKRRGRWRDRWDDEIETATARPVSLLIPIQSRGSRPPLIWFPGHDRLFTSALRLSAALGEDQPVWAMDIMRMRGASSLEELAAACGSALLQQPELGPWRLAGHCFGGLLAFESALFLEAAGARVDRLILVDALNPAWRREQKWSAVAGAQWGEHRARLAYHVGVLRSGTNRSRYLYLRDRAAAFFKGRSEHLVPSGVVGQHRALSNVWKPRPWKGQALIVREPGRRLEAPALGWNGVIRELREEVVPFYRTGPLAVERISILKGILEKYLDLTPAI
jgi:thioesterase domain-containing protein/acyl carrier protein